MIYISKYIESDEYKIVHLPLRFCDYSRIVRKM